MGIDRNAAPVIANGQRAIRRERHLDAARRARGHLVHGVVQHLGHQVMEAFLAGVADEHRRAAAHRLEPFEHLDVGRRIAFYAAARGRLGEQIVGLVGGHVRR